MNKLWKVTVATPQGTGVLYLDDEELLSYIKEVTESGGIVNAKEKFISIKTYRVTRFQ